MSFSKVSLTAGLVVFTATLGNLAHSQQQLPPELAAQLQAAFGGGQQGPDPSLVVQDVDLKETTCRKLNFTFKDGLAKDANLSADDTLEFGARTAEEVEVQKEATGHPDTQINSITIEANFSQVPQESTSTSAVKAKFKLDGSQLGETDKDHTKTTLGGIFEFEKNAEIDVVMGPSKAQAAEQVAAKFGEEFAGIKEQFPNLSMNLEYTDKNKEEVKKAIIDSPDVIEAEFGKFEKTGDLYKFVEKFATKLAAPNESAFSEEDRKWVIAEDKAIKQRAQQVGQLQAAFKAALNPAKEAVAKMTEEQLGQSVAAAYLALRKANEPLRAQQIAFEERAAKAQAAAAAPIIKKLTEEIAATFKSGANSYVKLNNYPQRRDVDGTKQVVEVNKVFVCQSNAKIDYPTPKPEAEGPKKGGAKPSGIMVVPTGANGQPVKGKKQTFMQQIEGSKTPN